MGLGALPGPGAACSSAWRDKGFRVVTIVDPGVKHDPGYAVYDDGLAQDVFCRTEGGDTYIGQVWPGNTAFPDFATPEARAWWGELNARHVESGLAGIWNDMNEPATGEIAPKAMRFDQGPCLARALPQPVRAAHGDGHERGAHAPLDPERRTFILSRAGFAGIQRYAANWMGDNQARWDHLWVSMPMALRLRRCRASPSSAPTSAASRATANPELFLRWMQAGTLTPFCRNHSETGNIDQYPWSFGPEVIHDLAREAVRLRYRLMPYIYAAFVPRVADGRAGAAPARPRLPGRSGRRGDIDDEYLFGRDLLVAPVDEPGMTSRKVYLPAGDWYDWHTGELHVGGSTITRRRRSTASRSLPAPAR